TSETAAASATEVVQPKKRQAQVKSRAEADPQSLDVATAEADVKPKARRPRGNKKPAVDVDAGEAGGPSDEHDAAARDSAHDAVPPRLSVVEAQQATGEDSADAASAAEITTGPDEEDAEDTEVFLRGLIEAIL